MTTIQTVKLPPVNQDAAATSLDYYRREAPKPVKTTEQSVLDQMFGYYAA